MLILASRSPRREEILRAAGFTFKTVGSNYEEKIPDKIKGRLTPEETAVYFASRKAEDVAGNYSSASTTGVYTTIGADTIVVYGDEILGKPKDRDDAFRMLSLLSGSRHNVITGICLIKGEKRLTFAETTAVEFYPLTEEEINNYIYSGEPFDKAGAYGIQEKGDLFVKRIEGDFFNVVGLPVARLARELKKL